MAMDQWRSLCMLRHAVFTCRLVLCRADAAPKQGVKRKAARKPRPKVTIEDLKKDTGLKHLVDKFPDQFRSVFRGPGHEVLLCSTEQSQSHYPCPFCISCGASIS